MGATCSAAEAAERLAVDPAGCRLLDVREYPEWVEGHAEGARLVPLSDLKARPETVGNECEVLLLCRTGRRAAEAAEILRARGLTAVVVQGGMEAWQRAGLPVRREKGPISLERQVRIAAGLLVLTGLAIPGLWPLSAFVGAGLVFAGVTNTCGMGLLLARMPWNRPPKPAQDVT